MVNIIANMINKLMLFCIIAIILILDVCAITVSPTEFTLEILFDKPKSQISSFSDSYTVFVVNNENFSITINATGINCSGITASMDPVTIPPYSNATIGIDFDVPSSLNEGKYTCNVKIFKVGESSTLATLKSTIIVKHPPPQLQVTLEKDIRKVKAGEKYTNNIIVTEIMGYKPARLVSININPLEEGEKVYLNIRDEKNLAPPFYFQTINPGSTVKKPITIYVADRNLVPGNYTLNIRAKAINNKPEDNMDYLIYYEIPHPVMKISGDLNFDALTFSEGKNKKEKSLIIEEIGGYTPIEGISIEKISGDEGWIALPAIDYVKPNSSENFTFKISLPDDAQIGKKEWKFKIRTLYAGNKEFSASTLVYFPSIDESIEKVRNMPKNEISENLMIMLENAKTLTEKENLKDLAGTMYIYSACNALFSEIYLMKNTHDVGEKLSHILNIKRSINKIEIARKMISIKELKDKASKILETARKTEKDEIDKEVENIRKSIEDYKENDYKRCAIVSKKIGEIYGNAIPEQKICEEKYKSAIENASKLKEEEEKIIMIIDENTYKLGIGRILINPFVYDFIIKNYNELEKIYENLIKIYSVAGEEVEAKIYEKKLSDLKAEKNTVIAFFMIYGLTVILILISVVVRIFIGFAQYKKDEEEKKLGDVIYG